MDIFCKIDKELKNQIIDETDNFYIIHDGFPLIEAHLLLIPKKHLDCYLNLDKKYYSEFSKLKKRIIKFLTENYIEPVIFEHGVIGQTVPHAHLHFLPTKLLIIDYLKKNSRSNKKSVPYLYFEYHNNSFYFQPKKQIKSGYLHLIYSKILNRSVNGIERKKDLNIWLNKVNKKYKQWVKKEKK